MSDRAAKLDHARIELRMQDKIERARNGLLNFTKYTKPDYEVNWHHKAFCALLNQFIRKEKRFLLVFMPPRHGKSELISRRLPAFLHGKYPNDEIMAASYNAELASDMTIDVQRIMDTKAYRELFPNSRITPEDSKTKYARNSHEHELLPYTNDQGREVRPTGSYRSSGVGGSVTGRGANWIILDDPVKNREEADSETFRDRLWKWYTSTLRTRLEKNGSIIITMTRWHEDDLAGRITQAMKDPKFDRFETFSFPAIKEQDGNPYDTRKIGEALWPNKYDLDDLAALQSASLRDWTSLYQQRPTALEGGVIKHSWLKYYDKLPEKFDRLIQSWDLTFKDAKTSDFVVGQVWGVHLGKRYLVDQIRARMGFAETCKAISGMSARWPTATRKLIEEKANGSAVIETLKRQGISGIIAVNPGESKYARLSAVSTYFEAGDVFYPLPANAPWIQVNIDELTAFPNAANDDTVDATSQALNDLGRNQMERPRIVAL